MANCARVQNVSVNTKKGYWCLVIGKSLSPLTREVESHIDQEEANGKSGTKRRLENELKNVGSSDTIDPQGAGGSVIGNKEGNELQIHKPKVVTLEGHLECVTGLAVYSQGTTLQRGENELEVTQVPRHGCEIPWNWSRIHHKGKKTLGSGKLKSFMWVVRFNNKKDRRSCPIKPFQSTDQFGLGRDHESKGHWRHEGRNRSMTQKGKIGLAYVFYDPHAQSIDKSSDVKEIIYVGSMCLESISHLLAWNAISKILNSIPQHIVFILVTTTLDQLPHTIVTMGHKFFFPKLKDVDIVTKLQAIAVQEGLEIDKDALKLIASKSDGSLQDVEMTLDQLSLLQQRISLPLAQELVGLIPEEKLVDLLDLALLAHYKYGEVFKGTHGGRCGSTFLDAAISNLNNKDSC
eukprot:Gb_40531 [translate_table: standard]